MLIQRAGTGTLPPPGFTTPPWAALACEWNGIPPPSTKSVIVGPATVTLGHDDSEGDDFLPNLEHDVAGREFGWDNESPARTLNVAAFKADWRPVTNGEFEMFLKGSGKDAVGFPKSWTQEDGEIKVFHRCAYLSYRFAKGLPGEDPVRAHILGICSTLAGSYVLR